MVKLFTHTDLDGIGCAILAKIAFKNCDIEYCGYNDINDNVTDFVKGKGLAVLILTLANCFMLTNQIPMSGNGCL